jgi:hypothetical protein
MANDLNRQIQAEEDRTGIKDPAHFSYSTFAKSARQRRDNLVASVQELRVKLEAAQKERNEAEEQFALASSTEMRDGDRSRRRVDRLAGMALR